MPDNLKKPPCAIKQDVLMFSTLLYNDQIAEVMVGPPCCRSPLVDMYAST